ncbi:helix-turn-helix transcriptional regulator [Pedobacter nyackensis]|uniref:Uncharacterized protein n=1 Tax=Pedobacter nyackensis TaxID=475255 RepID=A0A1W2DE67_9SPHI|nr:helix-turn-helix transcriptional regulator [Pedobacter nyackensis]SMC95248.1 hypothetical protein SAMN04488101_106207 [Pedobacter nyackensis]
MTSNKGDVIERIVRTKIGISELSRILHVSRTSIYNWFEHGHLNLDTICKIGQAINHDFANEFPEEFANAHLHHPTETTSEKTDENYSIQYWMNKYISLLEKYNELLSELSQAEDKPPFANIRTTKTTTIQHSHDAQYFVDKRDRNLTYI